MAFASRGFQNDSVGGSHAGCAHADAEEEEREEEQGLHFARVLARNVSKLRYILNIKEIKRESDPYCRKVNISIQKLRVDAARKWDDRFRSVATPSAFLLRKLSIKKRSYI